MLFLFIVYTLMSQWDLHFDVSMGMEAVTHALRWIASRGDSQTTHLMPSFSVSAQIQRACYKKVRSGMGSPVWNSVNVRHPPLKNPVGVLSCTCRSQKEMTE